MKFSAIITMSLLAISCTTQSCEYTSEDDDNYNNYMHNPNGTLKILIGRATNNHLDQIAQLSNAHYQNLKPILRKYFLGEMPNSRIEDFVNQTAQLNQKKNKDFTCLEIKEINTLILHPYDNKRVIVAVAKKWGWGPVFGGVASGNTYVDEAIGYCRFEKVAPQRIHIDFVLVTENLRNRGLAKMLINKAIKTFNGITECTFHVPENKILLCDFLKEKGCKEIETVRLDPSTGKVSTNSNILIKHIKYLYAIQSEPTNPTILESTTQAISTHSNANHS